MIVKRKVEVANYKINDHFDVKRVESREKTRTNVVIAWWREKKAKTQHISAEL